MKTPLKKLFSLVLTIQQGANAIVGMPLMSSSIMEGTAEIVAYGTAVIIND